MFFFFYKTLALLLLGESFRDRSHGRCIESNGSVNDQLKRSKSFVKHIIRPVEGQGGTVDVFLSMSDCKPHLNDLIKDCFGTNLVRSQALKTQDMADGWKKAWRLYAVTGRVHDYVLQIRNDMWMMKSILTWNNNVSFGVNSVSVPFLIRRVSSISVKTHGIRAFA